jgi:hypothetical protein
LGTLDRYPQRVPKQRYSPPNDEMAARIDRVVELYRRWQTAETEYKQALTELAEPPPGDPEHVTIAHMAARLEVERKTIYRHLGRSMT